MADTERALVVYLIGEYIALVDPDDWERELQSELDRGVIWSGRPSEVGWFPWLIDDVLVVCARVTVGHRNYTLRLDQLLLGVGAQVDVRHLNRCGLDNRRANLEVCRSGCPVKAAQGPCSLPKRCQAMQIN